MALGKVHARRLREVYRSAGWPSQDMLEVELLAAGMLERRTDAHGRDTLRVTDAGIRLLADTVQAHRSALSAHEALVERVALEMTRAGRIAWRGLSLRAMLPPTDPANPGPQPHPDRTAGSPLQQAPANGDTDPGRARRWALAMPDVFSIRHTTVESWVEPIVHEVKVRRADLLGDLKRHDKRAAYQDLGQCWYVLGCDARGRPVGDASEIPVDCGVMVCESGRLHVVRPAPPRTRTGLPFPLWMALARATPVTGLDAGSQALLGESGSDSDGVVPEPPLPGPLPPARRSP